MSTSPGAHTSLVLDDRTELREGYAEVASRRRRVPGRDLDGISEPAVLVIAHERRAEVRCLGARRGPS